MPVSVEENQEPILQEIAKLNKKCIRILDVGIGYGNFGKLIRDRFPDKNIILDGIEIWPAYKCDNWLCYDDIKIGDIRELVDNLNEYDIILAIDVIEHFLKQEGKWLLQKLKRKANGQVLVSLPIIEIQQGAYQGNPHEEHKTQWKHDEIVKLGGRPIYQGNIIGVYEFKKKKNISKKMNILWFSNTPNYEVSFSVQSDHICKGLANKGHNIFFVGWDYHEFPKRKNKYMLLPTNPDEELFKTINKYVEKYKIDIMVTLQHVEHLHHILQGVNIPVLHWYQLPSDPVASGWINIYKEAELVPMSKYSVSKLLPYNNLKNIDTIPHCVDIKLFKPKNKDKLRKKNKITDEDLKDKFVVGFIGRNSREKQIPRLIEAFSVFAEGKENAVLLLRTEKNGSWNIDAVLKFYGVIDKCIVIERYLDKKETVDFYNLMDILVSPSGMEGFCLPLIEAMACGVPVIANDVGGMSEIVKNVGIVIPNSDKYLAPLSGYYDYLVDVDKLTEEMKNIYYDNATRQKLINNGLEASRKKYSVEHVSERWEELLKERIL